MKKRTIGVWMVAAAVTIPAWPGWSAERGDREPAQRSGSERIPRRDVRQWEGEPLGVPKRASELIGMDVENLQDESVGEVEELAIDLQDSRVVQVILSVGGFLGLGEKTVAVPPGAFTVDLEEEELRIDMNQEKLERAPAFDLGNWTALNETQHVARVYAYYGQKPYFAAVGYVVTAGRDRVGRASQIIGMPVENLNREEIGDVEDLMVDVSSGRVVEVVVGTGGFLGLAEELSVVPPSMLRFNQDRDALLLDTTKETLAGKPRIKSDDWDRAADRNYIIGVYRAYDIVPYFNTNAGDRFGDDTREYVRERAGETLATTRSETEQQILNNIRERNDLSAAARNIDISTKDGKVILDGWVRDKEEKQALEKIAREVAGKGNVENRLRVKE